MEIATLIGLAAGVCTTISFLPQAIKIIKTRHTKDLSLGMYSVLITGVSLWLLYGILLKEPPIIIANAVTLVFAGTIFVMLIKYKS
ncbi:MAG: SemiSWEET transporter [Planctomycetes bacterium]|nr:SemiSWEET transporter [Planctomycetota bacterium]